MRLAELQRTFWTLATQPDPTFAAGAFFVGSDALSASRRLGIYADMFVWRQVDSLREDFPKLAEAHPDFYACASAYLAQHPSRHHSLAQLGDRLSTFLADDPTLRRDLPDLAALEWARAEVFEDADAPVLTQPTDLTAPLTLIPALRILDLAHDAAALWRALDEGRPTPDVLRAPTTVVVWRKAFETFHVRLDQTEATALKRAAEGAPLAAICEAFEAETDPVATALRAVGSWFAEGWIADTQP